MKDSEARNSLLYGCVMIGLEFFAFTAAWMSAITSTPTKQDKANADKLQTHGIAITSELRHTRSRIHTCGHGSLLIIPGN